MVTIDILVVDEELLDVLPKYIKASSNLTDGFVAAYGIHVHGCTVVSVDIANKKANVIPLHPELKGVGEFETPPITNMVLTVRNTMYGIRANITTREDAHKDLSMDIRLCSIIKKKMIFSDFDEIKRLKVEERIIDLREFQETTYAVTDNTIGCNFIVVKRVPLDTLKLTSREQKLDAEFYIVHSGLAVDKFIGLLKNG